MRQMNRIAAFVFAAAAALASMPASAQQQGQNKAPAIVKNFSGWDVRCFSNGLCDIWEATAYKDSGQFAVSVSVAYVPQEQQYFLQLVVPPGVDLMKGAKVVGAGYTSEALRYHHCDRIGCSVILPQGSAVVGTMKRQSKIAVRVVQFRGKPLELDVPMKGFSEALSYMTDLARQKASGAAATPAPEAPADGTTSNP